MAEMLFSGDDDFSRLEGTQIVFLDNATQAADATNIFGSNVGSSPPEKEKAPHPDVDVWGCLRRKGGSQEEFKLRHRLVDGRRDTYILGRSSTCDIALTDDKLISSAHCMIYCDYTQARLRVFVEDTSANGTFVNDSSTRLSKGERIELNTGDEICLRNPKLSLSSSSGGTGEKEVVDAASFMFINIRERVLGTREKSVAPSHSEINVSSSQIARHVEDTYVIGHQIGSGMCGTVHICVERATGTHCAVKIIDTKKFALTPGLSPADLREEAMMMLKLDHPNIIRIKDTFETENVIFIVMELVRGGDLFDRIVQKGKYSEEDARKVMGKVLSAVRYLHSKNIIHRDLKPENILLEQPGDDISVKITDFGLAKHTNQEGLKTFCGTPQYFAPEVLKRKNTVKGNGTYGTAADIWSLGVVLYILLSGAFPFDEDNLLDQVQRASYSLEGPEWANISAEAQNLVRCMMTLRPEQRLTVQQALDHPWMKGIEFPKLMEKPVGTNIRRFATTTSTTATASTSSSGHDKVKGTGGGKTGGKSRQASIKRKSTGKDKSQGSQQILQMLANQGSASMKAKPTAEESKKVGDFFYYPSSQNGLDLDDNNNDNNDVLVNSQSQNSGSMFARTVTDYVPPNVNVHANQNANQNQKESVSDESVPQAQAQVEQQAQTKVVSSDEQMNASTASLYDMIRNNRNGNGNLTNESTPLKCDEQLQNNNGSSSANKRERSPSFEAPVTDAKQSKTTTTKGTKKVNDKDNTFPGSKELSDDNIDEYSSAEEEDDKNQKDNGKMDSSKKSSGNTKKSSTSGKRDGKKNKQVEGQGSLESAWRNVSASAATSPVSNNTTVCTPSTVLVPSNLELQNDENKRNIICIDDTDNVNVVKGPNPVSISVSVGVEKKKQRKLREPVTSIAAMFSKQIAKGQH